MCPFCIGGAVLMAGSLMSAGGLATLVVNEFRSKKQSLKNIVGSPNQRRKHGPSNERAGESDVAAVRGSA
jgi:hypothetical protein